MRAAARFREVFGGSPAGVWAAPGRVNLIGEHTDYNQGHVLPFALPWRTYVAAAPTDDLQWTVWSAHRGELARFDESGLRPGAVAGWPAYPAGAVWALREAGHRPSGARLTIDSDLPVGAGLSSSAALTCAVLLAMVDLAGLALPRRELPALAHRAEREFAGVPCGIMDQSASLLARAGHALLLDCRTGDTDHLPLPLAATGLALLVIDTRSRHQLATGGYADRRTDCERAAAALGVPALRDLTVADLPAALARLPARAGRRVRHVVTEQQRVRDTVASLRAGALGRVGPLLSASHASLRDDFQVSTAELELAAATAEAAGARGARLTGGGFGGCVIALLDTGAVERVSTAVADAFAGRGYDPPGCFTAAPAAGAARLC